MPRSVRQARVNRREHRRPPDQRLALRGARSVRPRALRARRRAGGVRADGTSAAEAARVRPGAGRAHRRRVGDPCHRTSGPLVGLRRRWRAGGAVGKDRPHRPPPRRRPVGRARLQDLGPGQVTRPHPPRFAGVDRPPVAALPASPRRGRRDARSRSGQSPPGRRRLLQRPVPRRGDPDRDRLVVDRGVRIGR